MVRCSLFGDPRDYWRYRRRYCGRLHDNTNTKLRSGIHCGPPSSQGVLAQVWFDRLSVSNSAFRHSLWLSGTAWGWQIQEVETDITNRCSQLRLNQILNDEARLHHGAAGTTCSNPEEVASWVSHSLPRRPFRFSHFGSLRFRQELGSGFVPRRLSWRPPADEAVCKKATWGAVSVLWQAAGWQRRANCTFQWLLLVLS